MKKSRASKVTNQDEPQIGLFTLTEIPNSYRKPVQVVHSKPRAPMSLLQRKLANAWLKNAVETPADSGGWWTIGVLSMAHDIGFDSNNREYLRGSALELMRIVFEWDVIAPESRRALWKASVLFPEVEIRSDSIRYQISSQLRDRVLNPEIYALIDMNVVRKFRRGSSLALYEHCVRFEKIGRTTPVPWKELRDIVLGESAEARSYQEYKYFKSKVLNSAIAEINSGSDIDIQLEQSKIGRTVTTLQFLVTKKPSLDDTAILDEETLGAVGAMVHLGVPQSEAKRLAKKHTAARIKEAMAYTQARMADKKASKVANPAAYFRMALSHGWGEVQDAVVKKSTPKASPANGASKLAEDFAVAQMAEAENYFKELDARDQESLIIRYNDQQSVPNLRVQSSRATRGAKVAFFRWLAVDTWGKPTTEQLLAYAASLLSAQASAATGA